MLNIGPVWEAINVVPFLHGSRNIGIKELFCEIAVALFIHQPVLISHCAASDSYRNILFDHTAQSFSNTAL